MKDWHNYDCNIFISFSRVLNNGGIEKYVRRKLTVVAINFCYTIFRRMYLFVFQFSFFFFQLFEKSFAEKSEKARERERERQYIVPKNLPNILSKNLVCLQ